MSFLTAVENYWKYVLYNAKNKLTYYFINLKARLIAHDNISIAIFGYFLDNLTNYQHQFYKTTFTSEGNTQQRCSLMNRKVRPADIVDHQTSHSPVVETTTSPAHARAGPTIRFCSSFVPSRAPRDATIGRNLSEPLHFCHVQVDCGAPPTLVTRPPPGATRATAPGHV